jgi:uncharacterized protein YggE
MRCVTGIIVALIFYPGFLSADVLPDKPHIYVEGSAQFDVEPDKIAIALAIVSVDQDVEVAKRDVDDRSRTLISVCKEIGVPASQISSTTLSVAPSYHWRDGHREFEGTRVSRQIEVVLEDLSRYSELMQGIVSAKTAEITSTRLQSSQSAEFEDRALQAALSDATTRARGLAEAAGRKLGPVYSISEFQLRRRDHWELSSSRMIISSKAGAPPSMAYSADSPGQEPFTPGVITALAEIYVVFELKK